MMIVKKVKCKGNNDSDQQEKYISPLTFSLSRVRLLIVGGNETCFGCICTWTTSKKTRIHCLVSFLPSTDDRQRISHGQSYVNFKTKNEEDKFDRLVDRFIDSGLSYEIVHNFAFSGSSSSNLILPQNKTNGFFSMCSRL